MMNQDTGDEELMKNLAKGDRLAFELLYNRYFKRLLQFAQRYIGDTQTAEDIIQEVF